MISLRVPEEVIEGHILPWLDWNNLLRFRRVCTTIHQITTDYIRLHPELAPEIEINEDEKTFTKFMELGIGTKKLFINNSRSGYQFYQKDLEGIAQFLQKYGKRIEHLRLNELSISICGKEWDFLEALVNLKSVKANHLDGLGESKRSEGECAWRQAHQQLFNMAMTDDRFMRGKFPFPEIFRKLKIVDIDQKLGTWPIINLIQQTVDLLKMNSVLEQIKFPFNPHISNQKFTREDLKLNKTLYRHFIPHAPDLGLGRTLPSLAHSMERALNAIETHIKNRIGSERNLKCFDFASYHDFPELQFTAGALVSTDFLRVSKLCMENDVKLKNVSAFWFGPGENSPYLGIPVVSLVHLYSCVFPYLLENLTKIEIRATSLCNVGFDWRRQRPDWDNLKSVDITVDSKAETDHLFRFFFQDVRRVGLTELRLNFIKDADKVAIPRCEQIVDSCPNMKKLSIINWPGTNKKLVELWSGLNGLEEVALERCKTVGNVTFVGKDTSKPVFFGLKRLSKLSLLGLDKMPKITDLLFSLVIQHLPLTHLTLTSDDPIASVTQAGIQCLLNGSFNTSIENFLFNNWSLTNVSEDEFRKLEQQFRSYNMF